MVNMSGCQLRRQMKINFVKEPAEDAGGVITEFITELSLLFGSADNMFENLGESGVCIASEVALSAEQLEPIFRFFGRFLAFAWYSTKTINFMLSLPLIKLIRGEKLCMSDFDKAEPREVAKFEYFLNIPEEEWDMQSDVWSKMVPTRSDSERRQRTFYVPHGRGKYIKI